MSTQLKLIIPLLNESLTKEDFTKQTGFVNAYTYNKNEPWLLNHIFLLYESHNGTYENAKVIEKLNKLKSLYKWRTVKIGGKFYILYTICLVGPTLKKLLLGTPSFNEENIKKTLKFWNLEDDDVNRILLGMNPLLSIDNTSVPEEDYSIPDITTESGYKESLVTN